MAKPIIDDPELVVAAGGIVRIANGCTVDRGQVLDVRLPKSRLATFQVVEYFRAFLVGRVGWSRLRSLLIISGAFGLFRREAVEAVGGWRTTPSARTPSSSCACTGTCTSAARSTGSSSCPTPSAGPRRPSRCASCRASAAAGSAAWPRRCGATGRCSAGRATARSALVALPYFVLFELIGPLFELASFVVIPIAYAFGMLDLAILVAFAVVAVLLGVLLSVAALALEEFSFRRHPHGGGGRADAGLRGLRELRLPPARRLVAAAGAVGRRAPPPGLGRHEAQAASRR